MLSFAVVCFSSFTKVYLTGPVDIRRRAQKLWRTGLPDGLHIFEPKIPIWVNFGAPYIDWTMLIYIFFGRWEHFTDIWDIL
jgi:hypothetical protein